MWNRGVCFTVLGVVEIKFTGRPFHGSDVDVIFLIPSFQEVQAVFCASKLYQGRDEEKG